MMAIAVGVFGLLSAKHRFSEPTDYLEVDLHTLFAYMCLILLIILILEGFLVDESLVIFALLRCTCFIWLGLWAIHIGFSLYGESGYPRTDNLLLKPNQMQEMLDLLTCIGYMVLASVIEAVQALPVYLYLKWVQIKTVGNKTV